MEEWLFNIFGSIGVLSGWQVIRARNAVHSVFYLVMVFCNVSGLLFLIEVEFLGVILLVVYVGAVAVLFLFVVMMLAPREVRRSGSMFWNVLGFGMGVILLGMILSSTAENRDFIESGRSVEWKDILDRVSNVEEIGEVLFTGYFFNLIVAGFVLLVAMIGAVVLTKPDRLDRL